MKKLVAFTMCALSFGALGSGVFAATAAKKPMTAKSMSVMCPTCQKMNMPMAMTTMKTKTNTRAVKVNGKTMYCCAMCKMTTLTTKKSATKK